LGKQAKGPSKERFPKEHPAWTKSCSSVERGLLVPDPAKRFLALFLRLPFSLSQSNQYENGSGRQLARYRCREKFELVPWKFDCGPISMQQIAHLLESVMPY
jgi:hypothetical protein